MAVSGSELGQERGDGGIDLRFGGMQLRDKGLPLLMEGLPLRRSGGAALERLKLLLETGCLGLEAWVGGEGRSAVLLQLGPFGLGEEGAKMMMMPASAGAGGWGGGRRSCRLGKSRRSTCGGQRDGQEGGA